MERVTYSSDTPLEKTYLPCPSRYHLEIHSWSSGTINPLFLRGGTLVWSCAGLVHAATLWKCMCTQVLFYLEDAVFLEFIHHLWLLKSFYLLFCIAAWTFREGFDKDTIWGGMTQSFSLFASCLAVGLCVITIYLKKIFWRGLNSTWIYWYHNKSLGVILLLFVGIIVVDEPLRHMTCLVSVFVFVFFFFSYFSEVHFGFHLMERDLNLIKKWLVTPITLGPLLKQLIS